MTELKIDWKNFKKEIDSLILEGEQIQISKYQTKEKESQFFEDYNNWREKVLEVLKKGLGDNNQLLREFKFANRNNYNIPGSKNVQDLRSGKRELKNDLQYLIFNKNIWSVCDIITKPDKIDRSLRENYTSNEVLELILDKLYDVYDDYYYPVLEILEGNGIKLKKRREEFELVRLLESYGYVKSNNIGQVADAQLTIDGKIHVEEKRKIVEPDYKSISDNKEEIDSKIDELIAKLNRLGLGQEILFNELEELKEAYPKVDKKNWGQLVKGKLVDLGLSQVINEDTMKMIYKFITDDIMKLPY